MMACGTSAFSDANPALGQLCLLAAGPARAYPGRSGDVSIPAAPRHRWLVTIARNLSHTHGRCPLTGPPWV
jgi:hypothetical protein